MFYIHKVFLVISVICLLTTPIFAMDQSDELEKYLLVQNLEKYSESRNISLSSVLDRVGSLVLEDEKIAKGAVDMDTQP